MGRGRGGGGPYGVDDDGVVETRQGLRYRTLVATLTGDGRVRAAALVAQTFGLDPVLVLAEPDPFRQAVRLAAHNVYVDARNKAQASASG